MHNADIGYESAPDYEKSSYGKFAYKRVQRLRRKGQRRGIKVPYLGYALTKPEKPRTAFWIVAIVSAALLVAVIIGLGFVFNEFIKSVSIFDGMGDVFKALFNPDVFMLSHGLSAIPGMMIFFGYLLLIAIFALPIGAAIYFYRFVRDVFYMARCSKEEFAKGNIVSSRIFGLIMAICITTVLLIVLLSIGLEAKLLAGLVYAGILITLGGLLALMIVEKIKCGKWFDQLDEDKKQNYLEHERSLRRIKSRLHSEKTFWSNLGK